MELLFARRKKRLKIRETKADPPLKKCVTILTRFEYVHEPPVSSKSTSFSTMEGTFQASFVMP
ncbi:MAG: hypothetical protein LBP81_03385 [Treponema sp.]|nr:hypothetical protein [Treponema sp.]